MIGYAKPYSIDLRGIIYIYIPSHTCAFQFRVCMLQELEVPSDFRCSYFGITVFWGIELGRPLGYLIFPEWLS